MKKTLAMISLATLFASCDSATNETSVVAVPEAPADSLIAPIDTTPKVTGIGGIFFYSDKPEEANDWYAKNLGIETNDWGAVSFETRNIDRPDEVNSVQWKAFKTGDEYFSPSNKAFMINYHVQNLEGLVRKLRQNGVTIVDTMATYDFGKFIHIMDAEGNKIELYEPAANENSN